MDPLQQTVYGCDVSPVAEESAEDEDCKPNPHDGGNFQDEVLEIKDLLEMKSQDPHIDEFHDTRSRATRGA